MIHVDTFFAYFHKVARCQATLESGVCELSHSFFQFLNYHNSHKVARCQQMLECGVYELSHFFYYFSIYHNYHRKVHCFITLGYMWWVFFLFLSGGTSQGNGQCELLLHPVPYRGGSPRHGL